MNILIVDGSENCIKYKKINQELIDSNHNIRKASSVKDALGMFKDGKANGYTYDSLVICEILPDKDIDRIKEMKSINPNLFVVLVYDYYDNTGRYNFDFFIKCNSKNLTSNEWLGGVNIAFGKYYMLNRKKNYPCDTREKISCKECMPNAPWPYCCREECGKHKFCTDCKYIKDDDSNRRVIKPGVENLGGLLSAAYKFGATLDDEYQRHAFYDFISQLVLYVDHVAFDYRVHVGPFQSNR